MTVDLRVEEGEDGTRLDVLLVRRVDGMSRAKARRLIQDGMVRCNGRRAKKGTRLCCGDEVHLSELPPPTDFDALADPDGPLVVLHEDDDLVIVDKPAPLPSHPLRPDERATLAGRLLARYPEMRNVGYARREPGLLHRLDNDTSGIVIAARSARAFDALRAQLVERAIDKRYLVLVDGEVGPQRVTHPIAKHPNDPRRVHVCVDGMDRRLPVARPAQTEILGGRRVGARSLLEVRAPKALRHQVRAHLAAIGRPLVGDWLYGGASVDGLRRHFLHACAARLTHPSRGTPLEVECPLPAELARLVAPAAGTA